MGVTASNVVLGNWHDQLHLVVDPNSWDFDAFLYLLRT